MFTVSRVHRVFQPPLTLFTFSRQLCRPVALNIALMHSMKQCVVVFPTLDMHVLGTQNALMQVVITVTPDSFPGAGAGGASLFVDSPG